MACLRYIPKNNLWRPCDAVESAASWKAAIERKGAPSCLIFSRQNLKHQQRSAQQVADIQRGGYVRSEEHTSELQSLMRISYAVFCLKKKKNKKKRRLVRTVERRSNIAQTKNTEP